MNGNAVVLKLYKDGMIVYLNEELPFADIKEAVADKFRKSESFFQGIEPHVGFRGIALTDAQYAEIIDELSRILGCKVTLWEKPDALKETTAEKVVRQSASLSAEKILSRGFKIDINDEKTKFYCKTVRSGQQLESDGHIVIIGDVNPGAELTAAGNIAVMGTVKGTVHAGAKGNREAIVVALNLSPTQLRIADIITRAPDGDVNRAIVPEIAYIKDGSIFIEDFLQKKK